MSVEFNLSNVSNKQINEQYIPKTKQTIIQLQFECFAFTQDIQKYICASECLEIETVQNPVTCCFSASVIKNLQTGIQLLSQLVSSQFEMNWSVKYNQLIIAITFASQKTLIKKTLKMIYEQLSKDKIPDMIFDLQKLNQKYSEHYTELEFFNTFNKLYLTLDLFVFTKLTSEEFKTLNQETYYQKFRKQFKVSSNNLIKETKPIISRELRQEYLLTTETEKFGILINLLMISILNSFNIDLIVLSEKEYLIKKGEISSVNLDDILKSYKILIKIIHNKISHSNESEDEQMKQIRKFSIFIMKLIQSGTIECNRDFSTMMNQLSKGVKNKQQEWLVPYTVQIIKKSLKEHLKNSKSKNTVQVQQKVQEESKEKPIIKQRSIIPKEIIKDEIKVQKPITERLDYEKQSEDVIYEKPKQEIIEEQISKLQKTMEPLKKQADELEQLFREKKSTKQQEEKMNILWEKIEKLKIRISDLVQTQKKLNK